jgi:hypothetical protein
VSVVRFAGKPLFKEVRMQVGKAQPYEVLLERLHLLTASSRRQIDGQKN